MTPTLVIMAAGMGSRYGGLKQIDPVGPNGEIVLDYSVHDALEAGFGKIVFVIRRDIEAAFREAVGGRFEGRTEIVYIHQELESVPSEFGVPSGRTKPWGTGHAILVAEPAIHEPFAVINADDFYGRHGFSTLREFLSGATGDNYALVGFRLRNTLSDFGSVSRGVCVCDDHGFLRRIRELARIEKEEHAAVSVEEDATRTPLTGDECVSMNMWGFTPSLFEHLRAQFEEFLQAHGSEPKAEFYIPSVIDRLIREHKATVKVLPCADTWFGVTYPEDKPRVAANILELVGAGHYPAKL